MFGRTWFESSVWGVGGPWPVACNPSTCSAGLLSDSQFVFPTTMLDALVGVKFFGLSSVGLCKSGQGVV